MEPWSQVTYPLCRHLLPIALALVCVACASHSARKREVREAPARPSRAVQAYSPGAAAPRDTAPELPPPGATTAAPPALRASPGTTEISARARLLQVQALVDQTRVIIPNWNGADASMNSARQALARGLWGAAAAFATEAEARSDATLSDHYSTLAEQELVKTYQTAGLDDAQLAQLRAAEETLVAGNGRLAYGRLRNLNSQLAKRVKTYTVKSGDSLWIIAGREEVYANPWLWPLIWQANLTVLPNPNRLLKGQVLKLRPHPSADEVATAIREAKHEAGVVPKIGPVRQLPPR